MTKSHKRVWWKLKIVSKWLKITIDDVCEMCIDDHGKILTWIDASYAVHDNMCSQTGGVLTLGKGAIYSTSAKQKLNAKSSTES